MRTEANALPTSHPVLPANSDRVLRVATRQSPLAMWQARYVAETLAAEGIATEIVPLVSGGDTDMRPIDGTRQVGVFTKRIQQAVLADEADIAVHSLKDLPTEADPELTLAAVPRRESVYDCLVTATRPLEAWADELPQQSRIGTGSRRRAAQLRYRRPDLHVEPIRGNVQTRLQKLDDGEFDAIVLAEAGLLRLQMDQVVRCRLPTDEMLPAPGQGALGIEVRRGDAEAIELVRRLEDHSARAAVTAERTLLAALHGGCLAPIAALAVVDPAARRLNFRARVLSADGGDVRNATREIELPEVTERVSSDADHSVSDQESAESLHPWAAAAAALARQVGEELIAAGAVALIDTARVSSQPDSK